MWCFVFFGDLFPPISRGPPVRFVQLLSMEIALTSPTHPMRAFEEWARSLEESNAGILPETGQPLVSSTEWARLEDVAVRRSRGGAARALSSMFGRLI